eukprot:jgi/Chrzof1/7969/UNPLg00029.t1
MLALNLVYHLGGSVAYYMPLAVHAGRDDTVLQLTIKYCKERGDQQYILPGGGSNTGVNVGVGAGGVNVGVGVGGAGVGVGVGGVGVGGVGVGVNTSPTSLGSITPVSSTQTFSGPTVVDRLGSTSVVTSSDTFSAPLLSDKVGSTVVASDSSAYGHTVSSEDHGSGLLGAGIGALQGLQALASRALGSGLGAIRGSGLSDLASADACTQYSPAYAGSGPYSVVYGAYCRATSASWLAATTAYKGIIAPYYILSGAFPTGLVNGAPWPVQNPSFNFAP